MLEFFDRISTRDPRACAGWRNGVPVTHGELLARAGAWAVLGRRDGAARVALYHEDSLEFAAALLGAWAAGKTVWLPADVLPATCAMLAGQVDEFWGRFPPGQAPCAPNDTDVAPPPDFSGIDAGFAALVVFTSGSTGTPVAIPKRLAQLTDEVQTLERHFGAGLGDAAILATVSHQHIYGLLFRVLWPLAAGRAIDALRLEFPETMAVQIAARPCVLLTSPAHLKRLPEHIDWRGAAACVRAVFSSGGLLEAGAAHHAAATFGRMPVEVYGSSETGGVAWRQRGFDKQDGDDGWTPLPGVGWRLDDGVLAIRSAHAEAGQGGDGWLRTADRAGDLGGGRFLLHGRADRLVKIEEKRVSLDALEAALLATGLAREARVLAAPGGPNGASARQVLAAFVVPSPDGQTLLAREGKAGLNAALRRLLAQGTEAVALPRRWRYLDILPVDARGKTTQAQLLALLDGAAPAVRPRVPTMRLLERAPGRVLLELTVPADLLYFDGHFTAAPVLPGVVQLDWAIAQGRRHFALPPRFEAVHVLKFQQLIRPDQPLQLELLHDAVKGSLQFRYFSTMGAHASGRILFGADPAC